MRTYPDYTRVNVDGITEYEHIKVWEDANGPKPDGMDIHHINGKKDDNRLENLKLVTRRDHMRLHHGQWVRTDSGEWTNRVCRTCGEVKPFTQFRYRRDRGTFSGSCIECYRKNDRERKARQRLVS